MLVDEIRAVVADRLETLDGVVALAEVRQHVVPHMFARGDDLSTLVLEPRYPLALIVREILRRAPEAHLGVVTRGCQERALVELSNWKQIDLEQIEVIGFPCSHEQAIECRCSQPYPTKIAAGVQVEGVHDQVLDEFQATKTQEERLAFWQRQFAKCIKCYGCRTICPLCFCEECAMEQDTWVTRGRLPVPFPVFHVIKALHTAGVGKCVGCHACEDVCPADIPLALLYSLLRQDLKGLFGYEAGTQYHGNPPLFKVAQEA
jgi:formate dehydrogenase subunit beta